MSTVDELQQEISGLRSKLNTLSQEAEALTIALTDEKGQTAFYRAHAVALEDQLKQISQTNLENRLAFERIKAERNALWEVLKLQRDKHLVNLPDDGTPDPEPED